MMSHRFGAAAFHVFGAALLFLTCATIYSNTLDYPFVFDDSINIETNESIRVAKLDLGSLLDADLFRRQRKARDGDSMPHNRGMDLLPALFAAGVFVAHPIQTQSVTYIVQRMSGLATLFYLLALALYLGGRVRTGVKRSSLWLGSAACWVLAVGSKQIAVLQIDTAEGGAGARPLRERLNRYRQASQSRLEGTF